MRAPRTESATTSARSGRLARRVERHPRRPRELVRATAAPSAPPTRPRSQPAPVRRQESLRAEVRPSRRVRPRPGAGSKLLRRAALAALLQQANPPAKPGYVIPRERGYRKVAARNRRGIE